jgi:hypothetical protein
LQIDYCFFPDRFVGGMPRQFGNKLRGDESNEISTSTFRPFLDAPRDMLKDSTGTKTQGELRREAEYRRKLEYNKQLTPLQWDSMRLGEMRVALWPLSAEKKRELDNIRK